MPVGVGSPFTDDHVSDGKNCPLVLASDGLGVGFGITVLLPFTVCRRDDVRGDMFVLKSETSAKIRITVMLIAIKRFRFMVIKITPCSTISNRATV
jgi:hypothetical protein